MKRASRLSVVWRSLEALFVATCDEVKRTRSGSRCCAVRYLRSRLFVRSTNWRYRTWGPHGGQRRDGGASVLNAQRPDDQVYFRQVQCVARKLSIRLIPRSLLNERSWNPFLLNNVLYFVRSSSSSNLELSSKIECGRQLVICSNTATTCPCDRSWARTWLNCTCNTLLK